MTIRKGLPPETLQRAVELLRLPQSIEMTARQLSTSHYTLLSSLERAGLYDEFRGRKIAGAKKQGRPVKPVPMEGISNKFLKMKLRGMSNV